MRPDGSSREQLFGRVADHLYGQGGPSLWIVDDVPDGLDPAILHRMVIPAGDRVRTVFVAHTDRYAAVTNPVVLGPMTTQDTEAFLRRFREPDEAELAAFHKVAERLGGHPIALRLASERLRDREGLLSYAAYLSGRAGLDGSAVAADLLRTAIMELPPPARLVVQLAGICGPGSLPARLVATALAGLHAACTAPDSAGAAPDPAGIGLQQAERQFQYCALTRSGHAENGFSLPVRKPERDSVENDFRAKRQFNIFEYDCIGMWSLIRVILVFDRQCGR